MVKLRKYNEAELRIVEELVADYDDQDVLANYFQETFGISQEFTDFLIKLGGTEKLREFYYDALRFDLQHGTNTTFFTSEEEFKRRAASTPKEFADPKVVDKAVKHRPCLTSIANDAIRHSARILRNKGIDPARASFFDHGCGGGKPGLIAVSGALGFAFKKAIGIENHGPTLEAAKANAKAMGLQDKIELVHANSATYSSYNGVNVVFLYNPFGKEIVRDVAKMLAKYAGKVIVAYNKPENEECFDSKYGWKLAHEQGNRSDSLDEKDRHLVIFTRGFD